MTLEDKETFDDIFEDLKHYGVLGMKWGVRKDRKPQGYGNPNYKGPKKSKPRSADRVEVDKLRRNPRSSLSNKDLETANKRLRLEQEYKKLNTQQKSKGRRIAGEILTNVAKNQVEYALNQVSRKYVDIGLESVGIKPSSSKSGKKDKKKRG